MSKLARAMVRECGSGQRRLSGVESEWTNDDCGSRAETRWCRSTTGPTAP